MGSTWSHLRQRSSVRPVRSVIAIKSLLHFGQRWSFMGSSQLGEVMRENITDVTNFNRKTLLVLGLEKSATWRRCWSRTRYKCQFCGDEFDPLAVVVDWLDSCRLGDLGALIDMYDERATLECDCDTLTLVGRASIAAYWAPKLAMASAAAFAMDDLTLTVDGACLDYRNYEGNPVRLLFRFTPLGMILHTECGPFSQRYAA
jgi:hypothetical protein